MGLERPDLLLPARDRRGCEIACQHLVAPALDHRLEHLWLWMQQRHPTHQQQLRAPAGACSNDTDTLLRTDYGQSSNGTRSLTSKDVPTAVGTTAVTSSHWMRFATLLPGMR
jgi:hypothetical protein